MSKLKNQIYAYKSDCNLLKHTHCMCAFKMKVSSQNERRICENESLFGVEVGLTHKSPKYLE